MADRLYDPRVLVVCQFDLRGLRVRNLGSSCAHAADPNDPQGMRHIDVPRDTLGTLTGEIVAFIYELYSEFIGEAAGLSYDEYVGKILNPEILKNHMQDVPEYRFYKANRGRVGYWDCVKQLSGSALVAAHTGLKIAWDGLPTETLDSFSYIPWVELVDG